MTIKRVKKSPKIDNKNRLSVKRLKKANIFVVFFYQEKCTEKTGKKQTEKEQRL